MLNMDLITNEWKNRCSTRSLHKNQSQFQPFLNKRLQMIWEPNIDPEADELEVRFTSRLHGFLLQWERRGLWDLEMMFLCWGDHTGSSKPPFSPRRKHFSLEDPSGSGRGFREVSVFAVSSQPRRWNEDERMFLWTWSRKFYLDSDPSKYFDGRNQEELE